jgi:hypothetical protein
MEAAALGQQTKQPQPVTDKADKAADDYRIESGDDSATVNVPPTLAKPETEYHGTQTPPNGTQR